MTELVKYDAMLQAEGGGMTERAFLDGRVTLLSGDCLSVLPTLAENSVDSCVCDPPYHLTSIIKRFAKTGGADRKLPAKHHQFRRLSKGFMGKQWDGGDVAFRVETWAEVLRVLKPGSYLIAFSGTRTYHRMVCAIEDAGFDVRDQLAWVFGSGFPKSKNLGDGWGTALKPAWEPICLARKPLIGTNAENMAVHGVGGLNIDGCRVSTEGEIIHTPQGDPSKRGGVVGSDLGISGADIDKFQAAQRASVERANLMGRWPANVIHDGSDEVLAAFPDAPGQGGSVAMGPSSPTANVYGERKRVPSESPRDDSGSAARFFYTAKADTHDRLGSKHPTVKPLDLMQYLIRLVTPKDGLVLDCFAGTGSTGEAAWREGMRAVLIERESEYQVDIARRMELAQNPTKRTAVAKSKNNLQGAEGTPLFSD